jgi:hypothetical protein
LLLHGNLGLTRRFITETAGRRGALRTERPPFSRG